jgi:hypothetical protein
MRAPALLAAALVLAQVGASPRIGPTTPGGPVLDSLNRSINRPVPTLPAPPTGQHPADVWVPDRYVPVPGQTGPSLVPGHWERRIAPHENYVPPLVIVGPDGRTTTLPGGTARPPEERQSP